ncbi:MAG: 4Fe-4S binding protein [Dissulfurimicrobium sp.]
MAFSLYLLYAGYRFYRYYLWVSGQSNVYAPKFPSVEAFLPIGALTALKHLVLTGQFDAIHPAGLAIFIAVLLAAFLFRKGVCGWVCPVGLISNLFEGLGRRFGLSFCLKGWPSIPLYSLKYILLSFFLYIILFRMDGQSIAAFMSSPYNMLVDIKMLLFFIKPSLTTVVFLVVITSLSIILRNPWCRYLCPYGALLGVMALFSPIHVKRDETLCINCKRCTKICPACIEMHKKTAVRTPECQGCMECIGVCPVKNCLGLNTLLGIKPSPLGVAALTITLIFGAWILASVTGHWESAIRPEMLRNLFLLTGGHVMHP